MQATPLLGDRRHRWLVTGAAGFIGSHLVESLLLAGQQVVAMDNLATGHRHNITLACAGAGLDADTAPAGQFRFVEADICDAAACREAVDGVDFVLHQAALGSVPRSLARPIDSFAANVDGFVKLLTAAKDAGVRSLVYASSSSVYGDSPELPKVEARVGVPLSPYAATKAADELIAGVWQRSYGLPLAGLRYFNVFGARQDPEGAYAAVIPTWVAALLRGQPVYINGDGQTSRDFCYIDNVVQANIRAALTFAGRPAHEVFNIACGDRTTLNELYGRIRELLAKNHPAIGTVEPIHRAERPGDVRHSLADIGKARAMIGYAPTHTMAQGLAEAIDWYEANQGAERSSEMDVAT